MSHAWSSLDPKDLKKLIQDNSRAMNTEVLASLVSQGVFELEAFDRDALVSAGENAESVRGDRWSSRLRQICSFSRNATLAERHSVLEGQLPVAYKVPVLPVTDAFRAWFMDATVALADAWPRAMAGQKETAGPNTGRVEMARWMACACMLDMPDAVRAIHAVCPAALTFTLPLSNLFTNSGIGLGFEVKPMQLAVSPVWVAWQFSAGQCLDVLTEISPKVRPDALIGLKMRKHEFRQIVTEPVSLVEGFLGVDFKLICDNATFQRAIVVGSRSKVFKDAVEKDAQKSLLMASDKGKGAHRVPAYLDEGVYRRRPTETAISATMAGLLPILDGVIDDIDPALLDTNTLNLALTAHQPGKDQRDVAVLKLVLKVKEKAGLEAAQDLFWHAAPLDRTKSTPAVQLFIKNCDKVLGALMDTGIVEPHMQRPGRNTPMEVAQAMNSPMVSVMASWLARRSAHALIADMDLPSFRQKAPA